MNIERVRMLTDLKCGSRKYKKGAVLSGDNITPDLIAEIRAGTGLVELLPPLPAQTLPPESSPHVIRAEATMKEAEELMQELEEEKAEEEPEDENKNESEGFPCTHPGCGFVAKSQFGLRSHQRMHVSS